MASIICPTCAGTSWEIVNYIQYGRLYTIDTAAAENPDFDETNDGEFDEVDNWEIRCAGCETPAPAALRPALAEQVWK